MKAVKYSWYGFIAVFFIAGQLSGQREYYLMFSIMSCVLLYGVVLNLWTLLSLSYIQRIENDSLIKGESTFLHIEIYNERPFPFSLIRMKVSSVLMTQAKHLTFSLLPNSNISFKVLLPCPFRGIYTAGIAEIEVVDSFGLVRMHFNSPWILPHYSPPKIKIYPRLVKLPFHAGNIRDAKLFGGAYTQYGETYSGLRPYRPGDKLNRIHMKAFAQKGQLLVKTYEHPYDKASCLIYIDTYTKASGEEGFYLSDLACECAAAIAYYHVVRGYHVHFLSTFEKDFMTLITMQDFERFYNLLPRLEFLNKQTPFMPEGSKALHQTRALYVITPEGQNGIPQNFRYFKNVNITLIHIQANRNTQTFTNDASNAIHVFVGDNIAEVLGNY